MPPPPPREEPPPHPLPLLLREGDGELYDGDDERELPLPERYVPELLFDGVCDGVYDGELLLPGR